MCFVQLNICIFHARRVLDSGPDAGLDAHENGNTYFRERMVNPGNGRKLADQTARSADQLLTMIYVPIAAHSLCRPTTSGQHGEWPSAVH